MPRSLDPTSRLVFVLAADRDKNPQPRLIGKPLTIAQSRKMLALKTELEGKSPVEKLEIFLDAVMSFLSGWENITDPTTGQPIEFSRDKLEEVLAFDELQEIIECAASGGRLSVDDQKKSESQH